MKLFFSEFKPNYEKYYFPYQVWLLQEEGDEVAKIYEAGFLPIRNLPGVYYLSRSLRVDLSKFELSSENRRILNKTADFTSDVVSLAEFEYTPAVQKFCKDYMNQRFGKGYLPAAGVKNIFQKGVYNSVFVWKKARSLEPVGYAVCFINEALLQYAHVFYDLELLDSNIGIQMILQAVIWAKEKGRKFAYLGTVYNLSAYSYKTEFSGGEFFNGFTWSNNLEELKMLIERREEQYLLRDKEFIEKFYQKDILTLLSKYGLRVKL